MRDILLSIYKSGQIIGTIAAAQKVGLLKWVADNLGWTVAILLVMEYVLIITEKQKE